MSLGYVVPAVGPVVDGVQDQALVLGGLREVGRREEGEGDAQGTLVVPSGFLLVSAGGVEFSEAVESLGGDGCGGAIERLPIVERIAGGGVDLSEAVGVGCAGIPQGYAVRGGVLEIVLGGDLRGTVECRDHLLSAGS